MQIKPQIILSHLSYTQPDHQTLFEDLSFSFCQEKMGIVGKNGSGKSTLLKLITRELSPTQGHIQVTGDIQYCPQEFDNFNLLSIADIFNIRKKLDALERIAKGSIHESDFAIVGDDWEIREHAIKVLSQFNLEHHDLKTLFSSLSGGEQTRLMLANTFLNPSDFIILDEPTNNLDIDARKQLYNVVKETNSGMIIVSHDRTLLNLMDAIIEVNTHGLTLYGGNYDHFKIQKQILSEAIQHNIETARKTLKQTQKSIQSSQERLEQRRALGKRQFKAEKFDKLTAGGKKGRSEQTQRTLSKRSERMINTAKEQLDIARKKIEIDYHLNLDLSNTQIPSNKMILEIENLYYQYPKQVMPIIDNLNLIIKGPERIALIGPNGSGKSTLANLISGKLTPSSGKIKRGIDKIHYLDQQASFLNQHQSLLDNFLQFNPDIVLADAHHILAQFLFRKDSVHKHISQLSGGEKLRAQLACILMSKQAPQFLILDEPTNHFDFDSLVSIESALNQYQGCFIVISHDEVFVENIGVKKRVLF